MKTTGKTETTVVKEPGKGFWKRISKGIKTILDGDFLTRERMIRNLPFLLFLGALAMIYISNTYYAEKTFREIEATRKELKELRYQYIITRSDLMFQQKQTEIEKRAAAIGLKEAVKPPYIIHFSSKAPVPGKMR
jgi:hypothetical protein